VRSLSVSRPTYALSLSVSILFIPVRSLTAVPWRRLGDRRRRRTPGAKAFVEIFAGDEHPLGLLAPSLPFLLCETEHPNPKLFGTRILSNFDLGADALISAILLCWE
jgi:hypothetical protein